MNSLKELFKKKDKNLCSVFFTAGFPQLNDTASIIKNLEANKVDFIEVGLPYSDPLADGPTIQHSSEVALSNGINLDIIFNQLKSIKTKVKTIRNQGITYGYYYSILSRGRYVYVPHRYYPSDWPCGNT